MLLPILHALIYWQGALSAPFRGLQPPLQTAAPNPALASSPWHSRDTSRSPAGPGGAFTSPLRRQEFVYPFCCEAHTLLGTTSISALASQPVTPGRGAPASPSWHPAPFWSLFHGSGAHAGLAIKSADDLCSKQESWRCGSFSSVGHEAASQ